MPVSKPNRTPPFVMLDQLAPEVRRALVPNFNAFLILGFDKDDREVVAAFETSSSPYRRAIRDLHKSLDFSFDASKLSAPDRSVSPDPEDSDAD